MRIALIVCALALASAFACPAADTWFEYQPSQFGVVVFADTSVVANAVHVAVQYRAAGQSQVVSTVVMRGVLGPIGYTAVAVLPTPPGATVEIVQVVPVTLYTASTNTQTSPRPGVRY
jgi:hypothetical protein